jgi:hypothetical protein
MAKETLPRHGAFEATISPLDYCFARNSVCTTIWSCQDCLLSEGKHTHCSSNTALSCRLLHRKAQLFSSCLNQAQKQWHQTCWRRGQKRSHRPSYFENFPLSSISSGPRFRHPQAIYFHSRVTATDIRADALSIVVSAKFAENLSQEDILPEPSQQPFPQSPQDPREQLEAETLQPSGESSAISNVHKYAILEDGSHGVLQGQRKTWISCEDEPIR